MGSTFAALIAFMRHEFLLIHVH